MHECGKATLRRVYSSSAYAMRYFVGHGIDVGGGNDPLANYCQQFPAMKSCRNWDMPDGDAQTLPGIEFETFDFLHSSHCLEHVRDPWAALHRWCMVTKPGGHLVIVVPDEDMYEQGKWPSTYNPDHKHTFTVAKSESWSPVSVNVLDLARGLASIAELVRLERLELTYMHGWPRVDQTMTPVGECAIEFVLRRRTT